MIDDEMYGMMPSEKIAIRPTAPPVNMLSMPPRPSHCWAKNCCSLNASTPGTGM